MGIYYLLEPANQRIYALEHESTVKYYFSVSFCAKNIFFNSLLIAAQWE